MKQSKTLRRLTLSTGLATRRPRLCRAFSARFAKPYIRDYRKIARQAVALLLPRFKGNVGWHRRQDLVRLTADTLALLHGVDEGRGKIARLGFQPRLYRNFHHNGPVVGKITRSVVQATRPAFGDEAIYLP